MVCRVYLLRNAHSESVCYGGDFGELWHLVPEICPQTSVQLLHRSNQLGLFTPTVYYWNWIFLL